MIFLKLEEGITWEYQILIRAWCILIELEHGSGYIVA